MRTYIHTYMHKYMHTYIHTHITTHTYVHLCIHIQTYTYACMHTYIHTYNKESNVLDLQRKKIIQEQTEETEEITIRGNEMEIEEVRNLLKLFISPIEKLMDKFNGSVKEFEALFKVPKTNTPIGNLHQHI